MKKELQTKVKAMVASALMGGALVAGSIAGTASQALVAGAGQDQGAFVPLKSPVAGRIESILQQGTEVDEADGPWRRTAGIESILQGIENDEAIVIPKQLGVENDEAILGVLGIESDEATRASSIEEDEAVVPKQLGIENDEAILGLFSVENDEAILGVLGIENDEAIVIPKQLGVENDEAILGVLGIESDEATRASSIEEDEAGFTRRNPIASIENDEAFKFVRR